MPVAAMQRARKAIRSWPGNRAKLERKADPGIQKEPDKKKAQGHGTTNRGRTGGSDADHRNAK